MCMGQYEFKLPIYEKFVEKKISVFLFYSWHARNWTHVFMFFNVV